MGDCASRPSESEISADILETNTKNDNFFIHFPSNPKHSTHLSDLKSLYSSYNRKKQEYERKIELYTGSSSYIYLIEVQKLIKIHQPGLCFAHERPYTIVSLEPNGPYQETSVSDCYRPKWFRMIKFKTKFEYKKIVFEVKGEKGFQFGKVEVQIDKENQGVRDEWIRFENKMKIKVRIQTVWDEKKLYEDLIKEIEDNIKTVNEMIKDKTIG